MFKRNIRTLKIVKFGLIDYNDDFNSILCLFEFKGRPQFKMLHIIIINRLVLNVIYSLLVWL
jgi:hypothetical protein